MATARLLEAMHERAVIGGEEQDAERMTNQFEVVELGGKLPEEVAAANVAHHGDAANPAARKRGKRHELPDQRRRQVVDAEVAEVLEGMDRLAPAGPGHTRDDHELGGRTAVITDRAAIVGRAVKRQLVGHERLPSGSSRQRRVPVYLPSGITRGGRFSASPRSRRATVAGCRRAASAAAPSSER